MKKLFAYFVVILFAGVLSLSFIAFTNHPIKQQKVEAAIATDTIKANCAHHEAAVEAACAEHAKTATDACAGHKAASAETTAATETKACCKEAGKTESGDCAQAATCKHHKETVAEAK